MFVLVNSLIHISFQDNCVRQPVRVVRVGQVVQIGAVEDMTCFTQLHVSLPLHYWVRFGENMFNG